MKKPLAQVLLAPQSVAIIGQSNDATKTAGRPLKYLRQAGYAGRIYPINPRRDEVSELTLGVNGTNLLNRDIRNSVSYSKDEVLMPGASLRLFATAKY